MFALSRHSACISAMTSADSDVTHIAAIFTQHAVTHVPYFLCAEVRMGRKECWLPYCKIQPNELGHPGTSAILHFTYYTLGRIKSFSGILNSRTVLVSECSHSLRVVDRDNQIHNLSKVALLTHNSICIISDLFGFPKIEILLQ